jgi:DNA-directed RNA polymerase specialized sigma24 family protein
MFTRTNGTGVTRIEPPGVKAAVDAGIPSGIDDRGRLLDGYRQYLLMIANGVIGPELQAKLGASDLVQDTFVEAQRHLAGFRGKTEAELRAWLRKILQCRLAYLRRTHLATEMRGARSRSRPCWRDRTETAAMAWQAGRRRRAITRRGPS